MIIPNSGESPNTHEKFVADMAQIRSLVSVAYGVRNLPDTKIAQDVFLGDANLYIQSKVPAWASLTGDNRTRLRILTMKRCAVNILVAFSRIRREQAEQLSREQIQLTPAEAISMYETDISEGLKVLSPSVDPTDGSIYTDVLVSE